MLCPDCWELWKEKTQTKDKIYHLILQVIGGSKGFVQMDIPQASEKNI